MPTNRTKNINYMSKDFDSIKADLIAYIKRYFPNEFQDLMMPLAVWLY